MGAFSSGGRPTKLIAGCEVADVAVTLVTTGSGGLTSGCVLEVTGVDCVTVGVAVTEAVPLEDTVGVAETWGVGAVTSWIDAAMNGVMTDGARRRRFALGASGAGAVWVDAAWVLVLVVCMILRDVWVSWKTMCGYGDWDVSVGTSRVMDRRDAERGRMPRRVALQRKELARSRDPNFNFRSHVDSFQVSESTRLSPSRAGPARVRGTCRPAGLRDVPTDLKSIETDLKSVETGLKSVETGLKSVETGLKSVETGLKSVGASAKEAQFSPRTRSARRLGAPRSARISAAGRRGTWGETPRNHLGEALAPRRGCTAARTALKRTFMRCGGVPTPRRCRAPSDATRGSSSMAARVLAPEPVGRSARPGVGASA